MFLDIPDAFLVEVTGTLGLLVESISDQHVLTLSFAVICPPTPHLHNLIFSPTSTWALTDLTGPALL